MAFGIVMAVIYPFANYMNFGMWIMWGMGTFLMIPLLLLHLLKQMNYLEILKELDLKDLVPLDLNQIIFHLFQFMFLHIKSNLMY